MATHSYETTRQLIHRWLLPLGPNGATAADLGKAWAAAEAKYREAHGISEGDALPGDAVRFQAEDDYLVITFTVTQPDA